LLPNHFPMCFAQNRVIANWLLTHTITGVSLPPWTHYALTQPQCRTPSNVEPLPHQTESSGVHPPLFPTVHRWTFPYKLQNSVLLSIFKMWKIQNISLVGNLILSNSCEFYYDDVTVTSFIDIKYSHVADKSIPQGTEFCHNYRLYLLQQLKCQGLSRDGLHITFSTIVLSIVTYALPSFGNSCL